MKCEVSRRLAGCQRAHAGAGYRAQGAYCGRSCGCVSLACHLWVLRLTCIPDDIWRVVRGVDEPPLIVELDLIRCYLVCRPAILWGGDGMIKIHPVSGHVILSQHLFLKCAHASHAQPCSSSVRHSSCSMHQVHLAVELRPLSS